MPVLCYYSAPECGSVVFARDALASYSYRARAYVLRASVAGSSQFAGSCRRARAPVARHQQVHLTAMQADQKRSGDNFMLALDILYIHQSLTSKFRVEIYLPKSAADKDLGSVGI